MRIPLRKCAPALILFALLAGPVVGLGNGLLAQEKAVAAQDGGEKAAPANQSAETKREVKDENDAYRHSASVQWIGRKLRMRTDTAATTFEILNFAVLAVLVGYALLKMLPKLFRDRSMVIQKHLVDARSATEEASVRLNSVEERLSHLDEQIAGMNAQAEKDAAAEETRVRASIEDEKKRILGAAEQEIASATLLAQRNLQQYAAELAIEQAARKLVVSAETDRLLVQSFARRLAGDESKGGQN